MNQEKVSKPYAVFKKILDSNFSDSLIPTNASLEGFAGILKECSEGKSASRFQRKWLDDETVTHNKDSQEENIA